MECVFLTLMALFTGLFLVFCAKEKYKFILFGICSIIALGAVMVPVFNSLMAGVSFDVNATFLLFGQVLNMKIDPFSAFIIFLIAIICFLYLLNKFLLKDYKTDALVPEILTVALFAFILVICGNNGMFFYLGYFVLSLCALMFAALLRNDSEKIKLKLILYTSTCLITLGIMLLGTYSQSLNFNDITKTLINNGQYCNNIFILTFSSFALPALFAGDFTGKAENLTYSRYSEILLFETLFYSFCYYGVFKFLGIGAFPSFISHCVAGAVLLLVVGMKLYKLCRSKNLNKIFANLKSVHITLSLVFILFGVFGYFYNVPQLMILGYSAAFIFFTNAIIAGFVLQYNMNKMAEIAETSGERAIDLSKMSGYRKIIPVGLLSYAGAPLTIGFLGWIAIAGALFFGINSGSIQLKTVSIVLALFVLIVFVIQNYKIFLVMKDIYLQNSEIVKTSLPKLNFVLALMVVIAGLVPNKFGNLLFVPVSYFSGGTKFFDIFSQYLLILRCMSVYLIIFAVLVISYLVIRNLVLKKIKSRTKV